MKITITIDDNFRGTLTINGVAAITVEPERLSNSEIAATGLMARMTNKPSNGVDKF